MIRQAISCDICGTEKQLTNHWFVAYDQGGELRVSGWNSRNRLRAGAKHLCGQTCLHKLVDDFMARTLSARSPTAFAARTVTEGQTPRTGIATIARTDASLTSSAAYAAVVRPNAGAAGALADEFSSSARLLTPSEAASPLRNSQLASGLLATTSAGQDESLEAGAPGYSSRNWRAEAWKREREREQRAANRRPTEGASHRFIA